MISKIHILTHTHWDREWFLPAELVNEWLEDLFDRLFVLIQDVPSYRYILDGQTMILEDYLAAFPENQDRIEGLVERGNLLIGPYYGQNDWRAVSEESLIRNVYLGLSDAHAYGNLMTHGWSLDNFGHCSQSPQIHALFGLEDVFIWRGPVLPKDDLVSDFLWEGPDGTQVLAHFFIAGYRNFYNLAETTDYLELRIEQLKAMLEPYSPHGNIVFLDGYDTDAWPEDPFQFLDQRAVEFVRSTPSVYDAAVRAYLGLKRLPVVHGELYSGKYACIFPGSLSARTYLRIQNALGEGLLAFYVEPLVALLPPSSALEQRRKIEHQWRELLKTHLHDNIGGVSVDQVHEAMEHTYQRNYQAAIDLTSDLLASAAANLGLQEGRFAYLPSPYRYERIWLHGQNDSYLVSSRGSGFCRVEESISHTLRSSIPETFAWQNAFYKFVISKDGAQLNGAAIGGLSLEEDVGDTYSSDPRPIFPQPEFSLVAMRVHEPSEDFACLELSRQLSWNEIRIRTEEKIILDQSPLVQWQLDIDSQGTNYRLRVAFETGDADSDVFAKMPFSIERRPRIDKNLFGTTIPERLQPVLLAAREVDAVTDFPFQGFVALSGRAGTQAVFAQGLREYQVDEGGRILITLKRSVEWLAKRQLQTRIGDAGPYMYVPSAKDERETRFELGFLAMERGVYERQFLKWFYLFERGFVVFDNHSTDGDLDRYTWWDKEIPWSGLHPIPNGPNILRLYNPTSNVIALQEPMEATDPFGNALEPIIRLGAFKIENIPFQPPKTADATARTIRVPLTLVEFPDWPGGPDRSVIQDVRLAELRELAESLRAEQMEAESLLPGISEQDEPIRFHQTQHKIIRLEREILEAELSVLLNEWKRTPESEAILESVRRVGKQLNLARRKRRTYDYILSLFEH